MTLTCRFWISIWLLSLISLPALAKEPVFFNKDNVASVDLNGDSKDEQLLLMPPRAITIMGTRPSGTPVTLGVIVTDPKKIFILDEKDHGVRRILTYGNEANDYAEIVYGWNPDRRRYEKIQQSPE